MTKNRKRIWTNEEVENLLQMAAEELQKEFYTAMKTSLQKRNSKKSVAVNFDAKTILAKVIEAKS